jgi:hypothetical protein
MLVMLLVAVACRRSAAATSPCRYLLHLQHIIIMEQRAKGSEERGVKEIGRRGKLKRKSRRRGEKKHFQRNIGDTPVKINLTRIIRYNFINLTPSDSLTGET